MLKSRKIVIGIVSITIVFAIIFGVIMQQASLREASSVVLTEEVIEYIPVTEMDANDKNVMIEQINDFWSRISDPVLDTSITETTTINHSDKNTAEQAVERSYYISFGAFADKANAERLKAKIESEHAVLTQVIHGSNDLFLVFYEQSYPTKEQAITEQIAFNRMGIVNVIKYLDR